jgi:hypothetical protein
VPLQHLHDRRQLDDPRVGRRVDHGKIGVRRRQCCNLGGDAAVLGLDRRPLFRQGEDQRMGFGKGRRKLCNGRRQRNTYSAPLNGSAPPSRTSAIKPVGPLRKSTGVLAT